MNCDMVNFKILDVGYLNRNKLNLNVQNKSCSALSCRIDGNAVFNTANGEFNVGKGDIVYIPKGASYSHYTVKEKIIFIHFDAFGNTANHIQYIAPKNKDYVCELFKKMYSIWNKKDENFIYEAASILYEIIAKTSITLPQEKKYILSPAIQYINEQFCFSDFSLENACKLCNISRSYFNRIFKKTMNIKPNDYINKLKIDKAKLLLSSGAYTNSEIANLCGFSDIKYFYIVFKKITGTTTGKYQKSSTPDSVI